MCFSFSNIYTYTSYTYIYIYLQRERFLGCYFIHLNIEVYRFGMVLVCLIFSWLALASHFCFLNFYDDTSFGGSKRRLLHVSFKHPTGCPWEPPSVGPLLSCGKFWRLTREWNFGNLWVPQVLPPSLNTQILSRRCFFNGCFLVPLIGIYKWYILPIGGLYGTYHLLREPGNNHCFFYNYHMA